MPRLIRIFTIAFFVLMLSACANFQVGHDFDVGMFATKIQPGVTTEADVRSWLGEPDGTGISMEPDGTRYDQWNYFYGETNMSDTSKTKIKILQVKFDKNGKVRSYNWSSSK